MSEREKLVELIREAADAWLEFGHRTPGSSAEDAVADALLADGWAKGREEWGVRYPECVNSGYKSEVQAHLDATHWNGTVVRRYVTDWEEA